jgi:nucleoside-diphosphate-sugar epimerase
MIWRCQAVPEPRRYEGCLSWILDSSSPDPTAAIQAHSDMSTICVIGGTGFLGSHLLKLLETDSHFKLKVLSRDPTNRFPHSTKAQIMEGNLLNASSLSRFLEPASVVVNLAYLSNRSSEDNLRAARNLAEACTKSGIRKLIHISTAVVVGRCPLDEIDEETLCQPVTDYEKVKLAIERMFLDRLSGVCEVTVLRPTEIFGSGGAGLVRLATEVREAGPIIRLKCRLFGTRRLHLIFVDNVVAAIDFMVRADERVDGECYLVSDDEADQNTYSGVIRVLEDSLGITERSNKSIELPSFVLGGFLRLVGRSDSNPRRVYRCDKLLRAGFRKPIPFEEGIRRFADWFKGRNRQLGQV